MMRNLGASLPPEGRISHLQGSISSETGQYPARVTPSSLLDPNSNTLVSDLKAALMSGLGGSAMAGDSKLGLLGWGAGGRVSSAFFLRPKNPMVVS